MHLFKVGNNPIYNNTNRKAELLEYNIPRMLYTIASQTMTGVRKCFSEAFGNGPNFALEKDTYACGWNIHIP